MTHIEPFSAPPETPVETFCSYLANKFIAKNGFQIASVPEFGELAPPGDILLTCMDGDTFTLLCMIDRETNPNAAFNLDVRKVRQIGEACLRYTRRVHRRKMPVFIRIMEIGPGSAEQQRRLKPFKRSTLSSRITRSAMIVDTVSGEVWSSDRNWISKGAYHGFVENLLATPRDADLTPTTTAIAEPSFPFLTVLMVLVLFAVFAAEIAYGIGPPTKLFPPTTETLWAFGGLIRARVIQNGEWYRLLSAPFLHANAIHLAMNSFALLLAGARLESLIGRAWFGTAYVAGALGGSLLSLALNPASIVSVGASGAITGLFAAMLVISRHFPWGPVRDRLRWSAFYVLIPSLLPLASATRGVRVDYAAHFGGAIGGVAVGLIMRAMWPRSHAMPRVRPIAATIALAGAVALVYPALSLLRGYQAVTAVTTLLIPADQYPKSAAEMRFRSAQLIARYPHDPRPRLATAATRVDTGDLAGAEREARAGLAEEDQWRSILPPEIGDRLRVFLAIAISEDRPKEALATARPVCAAVRDGPLREVLDDHQLCRR
jgi:rhomboid protease GluP